MKRFTSPGMRNGSFPRSATCGHISVRVGIYCRPQRRSTTRQTRLHDCPEIRRRVGEHFGILEGVAIHDEEVGMRIGRDHADLAGHLQQVGGHGDAAEPDDLQRRLYLGPQPELVALVAAKQIGPEHEPHAAACRSL